MLFFHIVILIFLFSYLYIFGGWNGRERLNDLYILDTGKFRNNHHYSYLNLLFIYLVTLSWSQPICEGFLPQPRAGMSLTVVDDEVCFILFFMILLIN